MGKEMSKGEIEALKQQTLSDFAKYVNPQKARVLKNAGLSVIEGKREGASVWDITGEKYIDCITSAGSFNVGRRNPEVLDALRKGLDEYDLGVFLLCSKPKADLAKRLAEITPGDLQYTMYGCGGGEANDFAIKLARGFSMKTEIISTVKAYHGHTGFSLAAIGRDEYKKPFFPMVPGFSQVKYNDLKAVEEAITEDTAAVMIEPVQGEGGIHPATDEYMRGLRKLCDDTETLLIFDEIQTGFGRTGKMFCCEHSGVVPDIMTVAKSLGGALYPISATIYREELNDFVVTHPFTHLSTFGGSDLGCIVGLAVIDFLIKNNIPEHAAKMGERFQKGFDELLKKYPELFKEVRRMGLMMGLQYTNDSIGPRMSYQLALNGVMAIYTGNEPSVMRLMPTLTIQPEEVDFVVEALDKSMAEIMKQGGIEEY
ncbi:MAG: aspartate aminotransferase family protein [Deltaproteobacteria bacterium]|uniref:Aspartate aminotransferase family protein n=1 Tax=Candidatus Zymogenus saltonus TaxID=2844893 RepID=A0A9D8PP71_9DELT|nr:aspartate aminotransferase family protein [Candidatus Zymogenus saltonus]